MDVKLFFQHARHAVVEHAEDEPQTRLQRACVETDLQVAKIVVDNGNDGPRIHRTGIAEHPRQPCVADVYRYT